MINLATAVYKVNLNTVSIHHLTFCYFYNYPVKKKLLGGGEKKKKEITSNLDFGRVILDENIN